MEKVASPNSIIKMAGPKNRFPKVKLMAPTGSTYIIVALEIDHRPPFFSFLESGPKKKALTALKEFAGVISGNDDVIDATVFKMRLAPPGKGQYLTNRPDIHVAKFDVVMLVELETAEAAHSLRQSAGWQKMEVMAASYAKRHLVITADNPRMIAPVDHTRQGVFLFNFFYADDIAQNLAIWEYTAGWFTDQTGLDNSCLLAPAHGETSDYTVINHCRWDSLWNILPSIIFKPSFKTYVEGNFNANRTAPIPILYKLA